MRIAEFGTVYRYEQSGELHGLSRVRGFTQDDAHIFCTSEQVKEEFLNVLDLTRVVLKKMGFQDFTAQISLRDPNNAEKYIGSNENWENAERAIMEAAEEAGLKTVTELGEAAFYGPKLDFMVKDALGRSWQLGTIQVDYNLPERFNLSYTGADNKPYRPVMIHRAPFGSMERFISIMIENTAGKFPLWLTSDQFAVLPISDRFIPYCKEIVQELAKHDIRGFVDERAEKIGRKIRDAEVQHIPFMLVVGEQEQENKMISVRRQGQGDLGSFSAADFVTLFRGEMEKENV
jgi:threonyl-tRNA synthetase